MRQGPQQKVLDLGNGGEKRRSKTWGKGRYVRTNEPAKIAFRINQATGEAQPTHKRFANRRKVKEGKKEKIPQGKRRDESNNSSKNLALVAKKNARGNLGRPEEKGSG